MPHALPNRVLTGRRYFKELAQTRRRAKALQLIPKMFVKMGLSFPHTPGDCRDCPRCLYRDIDPPYCCGGQGIAWRRTASMNPLTLWEGIISAWVRNQADSRFWMMRCIGRLHRYTWQWPGG